MCHTLRQTVRVLSVAALALSVAGAAAAQPTTTKQAVPGAAKVSTAQLRGEVQFIKSWNRRALRSPNRTS